MGLFDFLGGGSSMGGDAASLAAAQAGQKPAGAWKNMMFKVSQNPEALALALNTAGKLVSPNNPQSQVADTLIQSGIMQNALQAQRDETQEFRSQLINALQGTGGSEITSSVAPAPVQAPALVQAPSPAPVPAPVTGLSDSSGNQTLTPAEEEGLTSITFSPGKTPGSQEITTKMTKGGKKGLGSFFSVPF